MAHKPNFTAQLTNKEAIREVASSIGCVHTRGAEKDGGSIREMLEEIGAGEVLVLHHVYDDGERMREDVKEIRKIAKQYLAVYLGETLLGLAAALESASQNYDD